MLRRERGWPWTVAVLAACTIGVVGNASAQDATLNTVVAGIGAGVFADYPTDFSSGSCQAVRVGGLTGFVRRSAGPFVALEASATVTSGFGGSMCVDALRAAPLDGEPFSRSSVDEDIAGTSFFATSVSAVVDPLTKHRIGPRFHIGAGRLWDKRLWSWVYGAGVRFALGPSTVVLDVERWNLAYDLRREVLIYREGAPNELQSVEILRQTPKPWLFRLGWERRIR